MSQRPDAEHPSHAHEGYGEPKAFQRELFGTRLGFILAAVGSAVGLGNMWRFPYVTAERGGAAFVLLYVLMVFLVGIPVLLAEFSMGRRTRLSPIGALRATGGRRWSFVGYLFVIAGLVILSYYSVIAGWVMRYMFVAVFEGFPADLPGYFATVTQGWQPLAYHLAFMAMTITIVMSGIEKGIERASFVMMPTLFLTILGLAIWAATLDGSGGGYRFYLDVSWDALLEPVTFAEAAGQAFFSLSLGMGAMLTFASYLSREEDLVRESGVIAFADFGVAFLAGLVVFPVIFALGLQNDVVESAVGALFISLPGAFVKMGLVGRVVGSLFFVVLFVGAVTSAISLLEVVTSSAIDELNLSRRKGALGAGLVIAALGAGPALSLAALDVMDRVASEVLLPLGGLILAIFAGWVMKSPLEEAMKGVRPRFRPFLTVWLWLLRLLAPVALVVVLFQTVPAAARAIAGLFGGG